MTALWVGLSPADRFYVNRNQFGTSLHLTSHPSLHVDFKEPTFDGRIAAPPPVSVAATFDFLISYSPSLPYLATYSGHPKPKTLALRPLMRRSLGTAKFDKKVSLSGSDNGKADLRGSNSSVSSRVPIDILHLGLGIHTNYLQKHFNRFLLLYYVYTTLDTDNQPCLSLPASLFNLLGMVRMTK